MCTYVKFELIIFTKRLLIIYFLLLQVSERSSYNINSNITVKSYLKKMPPIKQTNLKSRTRMKNTSPTIRVKQKWTKQASVTFQTLIFTSITKILHLVFLLLPRISNLVGNFQFSSHYVRKLNFLADITKCFDYCAILNWNCRTIEIVLPLVLGGPWK